MARRKKEATAEVLTIPEFDADLESEITDDVIEEPTSEVMQVAEPVQLKIVDDENDIALATSLTPEQRELRRLANRPSIDHLPEGVAVMPNGDRVPLFNVNDRIVVERYLSWAPQRWLDTRTYIVRSIDDETGAVRCLDEECNYFATVGFKHPGQNFKLAPKRGNPFNAPKLRREAEKAEKASQLPPGTPKRRGRPKGSANRPKEEIKAEKEARKAERRLRKEKRKSK